MKDAMLGYARGHGLGSVDEHQALNGELRLAGGERAPAELVASSVGLYLIAAKSPERGVHIDLIGRGDARYLPGRLHDAIQIGEVKLDVPAGRGKHVRELIALARLNHALRSPQADLAAARHVPSFGRPERAIAEAVLEPGESLLAMLETKHQSEIESAWGTTLKSPVYFLLSGQRALLVACSDLGDLEVEQLGQSALRVLTSFGRVEVQSEEHRFRIPGSLEHLYRELVELPARDAGARFFELARLNFVYGRKQSRALVLAWLAESKDPSAGFATLIIDPHAAVDLTDRLDDLRQRAAPRCLLADVWGDFAAPPKAGMRLVRRLRSRGADAEPWALELHLRVHERALSEAESESERTQLDIELSEHLLLCDERARAITILNARIPSLPSEELLDLLPPSDADLTRGAGGQALRTRIHELLSEARSRDGKPDQASLLELARLHPLVEQRVRQLFDSAEGALKQRAASVLRVLEPGGLDERDRSEPPASNPKPLSDLQMADLLRHPLAREDGPVLGRLQALLAAVPTPDHGMLRDYCEQLGEDRHGTAARALIAVRAALGVPGVLAYVSRGAKGVGVRSYESSPRFVLVGGRHLDEGSEYLMTPLELRFAIGAEVAHLRYGHTRVTSSDVWKGALEKSKDGLDFALGVLPLFKGIRFADQLGRMVSKVPTGSIKKVVTTAGKINKRAKAVGDPAAHGPPSGNDVLSHLNEELVAAHRVMQLTADRAGLLMCGDLPSALRAMLLVRPDFQGELDTVRREGLPAVLGRRTEDGQMKYQDLAVRVAALLSFYLSNDYVRLRAALGS